MEGHIPFSPFVDQSLEDNRVFDPRHFDGVVAPVVETLSAGGAVLQIPSGNTRLFHYL